MARLETREKKRPTATGTPTIPSIRITRRSICFDQAIAQISTATTNRSQRPAFPAVSQPGQIKVASRSEPQNQTISNMHARLYDNTNAFGRQRRQRQGVGEDITLRKFTIGKFAQMYDYQITGYSNESQDEYTLFGPIDERVMEHQSSGRLMQPTNMEWVTKTTARIEDGILDSRTPVIVRGLTGPNAHLNGEIGYTLSIRLGDYLWKKACVSHYGVHFENAELGECKISAGNLRVLFDLPDERSCPDCG
ncbi:hypothetical protein THAOC_27100 [Thalassiosira oceanica]|uniref:Uncharacterized protein n=1 Tax=Thalassiosira oceanica TaxID=159749 RepID=K0RIC2_THAOC|nr:hypothetical protein THAOC_27100 [Thalassiosira oceanica]|eukprot:EJK53468.1 hypothetical protein THAOC_27100 [Thalassiosira oceanica]